MLDHVYVSSRPSNQLRIRESKTDSVVVELLKYVLLTRKHILFQTPGTRTYQIKRVRSWSDVDVRGADVTFSDLSRSLTANCPWRIEQNRPICLLPEPPQGEVEASYGIHSRSSTSLVP